VDSSKFEATVRLVGHLRAFATFNGETVVGYWQLGARARKSNFKAYNARILTINICTKLQPPKD
jgi:hypothetical protein